MNKTSQETLYFIGAEAGPPLQDNYIETLQNALEAIQLEIKVKALTALEFIQNPPNRGVIWPYFRGSPPEHEQVLEAIDTESPEITVINNYNNGDYNLSDKWKNYEKAAQNGIAIPESFEITEENQIYNLELEYPIVIKGHPSGRGQDVHLCNNIDEAKEAFQSCTQKGLQVLAQEFIEESRGRDLRVLVVDGKIALILGRQGAEGSFLSNVSNGGHYFEYDPTQQELETIQAAIKQFPVDLAGFDFLFSDEGLLFCEINLAPGWSNEASAMLPLLAKLIQSKATQIVPPTSP